MLLLYNRLKFLPISAFVNASVSWALVIIPSILIDQWVKSLWPAIEWIPIVPVAILLMGSLSAIWIAAYVYLFYRKVVDSGSEL